MAILTLHIENMHCGSCIRRVTQTLNALPGTHAKEVRVGSARVHTSAAPATLQQSLATAGYPTLVEFSSES
jgi:copper chaperone